MNTVLDQRATDARWRERGLPSCKVDASRSGRQPSRPMRLCAARDWARSALKHQKKTNRRHVLAYVGLRMQRRGSPEPIDAAACRIALSTASSRAPVEVT